MKRTLALLQGSYYSLTGLWPLVHIDSFIDVTGPKTDIWLVRTVGVLALAAGIALISSGLRKEVSLSMVILATGFCVGFACIDIVYVSNNTISRIYLLDAAAELLLFILWIVALAFPRKK